MALEDKVKVGEVFHMVQSEAAETGMYQDHAGPFETAEEAAEMCVRLSSLPHIKSWRTIECRVTGGAGK